MIIRALLLTLGQWQDRRIIGVFAKSMLLTLIICSALAVAIGWGVQAAFNRWAESSLMDGEYSMLTGIAGGLIALLLIVAGFRAVAIPVMGLFGDAVVSAVEDRHYPAAAASAVPAPLWLSLRLGLASFARVLLVNLAALPLYLFLLITAIGPLLLFVGLNAILLGRDLAEMVAVRHLDPSSRKQWLRNHRLDYALLGLIVTGLFLIPIVNLVAPLIGAGAATHLFHRRIA